MSRPGSQSRYSPDLGPAPQVASKSAPPPLAQPPSLSIFPQLSLTSYCFLAEQAGVGLMLGENTNFDGVVVKQLVPKGAADRTGKV